MELISYIKIRLGRNANFKARVAHSNPKGELSWLEINH